jgi:hypothetical protein
MTGNQKHSLRLEKGSWRWEARTMAGSLLVLTLLGLLSWLCLVQASKVSAAEYRIWEKEAEMARLQRENTEALAEVVEMLSISRLEGRALELGYVFAEEYRYLDVPGYSGGVSGGGLAAVPRLDGSAVVALEEPRDEPAGVAQWWKKVVSQFVTWAGKQP